MRLLDHLRARTQTRLALRWLPEARQLRLGRVIKVSSETVVMSGAFGERPVVIKRMLGPEAVARAGAQAEELAAQYPRMADGRFRVPEPILTLPQRGVVVMERAPGIRLDLVLRAEPHKRAALLRMAGEWLVRYTTSRRVEDSFGGGFWIKSRKQTLRAMPSGPDRERLAGLIERMKLERNRIGPRPITRARSHGDFCALNLLVDGDTLWGVDIHNDTWIALIKDLARFLVQLEITQPHGATDGPCGLAAADAEALFGTPGLVRAGEVEAMLPFFAAVELSGRLVTEAAYPKILSNARALADRMLG